MGQLFSGVVLPKDVVFKILFDNFNTGALFKICYDEMFRLLPFFLNGRYKGQYIHEFLCVEYKKQIAELFTIKNMAMSGKINNDYHFCYTTYSSFGKTRSRFNYYHTTTRLPLRFTLQPNGDFIIDDCYVIEKIWFIKHNQVIVTAKNASLQRNLHEIEHQVLL